MTRASSDRHPKITTIVSRTKQRMQPLNLLLVVLSLRSSLFLAELIAGFWVHSLSLLAVSGHMLVDVLAIAVALVAALLAERSSTQETLLDPRQIEAGAAMVNSFILMVIAALITWGVVQQLSTPASEAGLPMLVIAVGGLVVQGVNASLLYQDSHHNLNLRGLFFHALADAASSLGLLIAALAIFYLNWLWADTAASILVVILAFVSATLLLRDSLQTLKNRDAWA